MSARAVGGAPDGYAARRRRALADAAATAELARAHRPGSPSVSTPPRHVSRWLTLVAALPVHLLRLALLVGGGWWVLDGDTWVYRVLGAVGVVAALGLSTAVGRRPDHVAALMPGEAPATFAWLSRVGEQVGARPPRELLVTEEPAVRWHAPGRGRPPVLLLGAPLWVACSPDARVALLAQELARRARRDRLLLLVAGTAERTLASWVDALTPARTVTPGMRMGAGLVETALTRAALGSALRPGDLWTEVRAAAARADEDDRQRWRRAAQASGARVDDDHAADHLRRELVQRWAPTPSSLSWTAEQVAAVDAELEPALAAAARSIGHRLRHGS